MIHPGSAIIGMQSHLTIFSDNGRIFYYHAFTHLQIQLLPGSSNHDPGIVPIRTLHSNFSFDMGVTPSPNFI